MPASTAFCELKSFSPRALALSALRWADEMQNLQWYPTYKEQGDPTCDRMVLADPTLMVTRLMATMAGGAWG